MIFQLQVWCKFVPFICSFLCIIDHNQRMLTKILEAIVEDFQEKLCFQKQVTWFQPISIPTENIRPPCSFLMFPGRYNNRDITIDITIYISRDITIGTNRQNKKHTC